MSADPRQLGPGGAPTRATSLPTDAAERKQYPVATGVLEYFPDAIAAVSHISWRGNQQHNPGQPLHWARGKSTDEADTMMRHFLQRGTLDVDGVRHTAKMVWRALAILQKEIEAEQEAAREVPVMSITVRDTLLCQCGREIYESRDERDGRSQTIYRNVNNKAPHTCGRE